MTLASKITFHALFWGLHIALFAVGFVQQRADDELRLLNQIGTSVLVSRASALVLSFDCAALLLGVCRNVIRVMRQSSLNRWIPFDDNIYFHRWTAYSMLAFTFIHVNGHVFNFYAIEDVARIQAVLPFKAWQLHYTTYAGITGHVMLLACFLIYTSAKRQVKAKNFELFWYTHHLFIVFYIALFLHSFGCFVKSGQGKCKGMNSNYYTVPAFSLYVVERLVREYRSWNITQITTAIRHPNNTIEIRFDKPDFLYQPGQYLFLNVPEISIFQWHPLTISSCPEEGFISIHIRIVGDWTRKLAELVDAKGAKEGKLPGLRVDGPYGAPSEDVYKYEAAILVGAGIGVTPAASILKSIWYRYYRKSPMPLKKVYFYWINRDTESFAWFQSLLASLEETVSTRQLEIFSYITAQQALGDIHNIILNDDQAFDPVTELKTRTNYGRPEWTSIFQNIRSKTTFRGRKDVFKIGVFFCGPKGLGKSLAKVCHDTSDDKIQFVFHKEHF